MSKKIISVSRRTDIPAFYGEWFLNRINDGFVPYMNPFNNKISKISLKPEDVSCFVFWSKNYKPFLPILDELDKLGYNFYFNYTITGLPNVFECNLCDTETSIETLKYLSKKYSPKHINWRYDPIVMSSLTHYEYHVNKFDYLSAQLEGYVERCYFSYVSEYGKVQKNFNDFELKNHITFDPENKMLQNQLADEFVWFGKKRNIQMYACSSDFLVNGNIKKAHCIDGELIKELFGNTEEVKKKPTRLQCGCFDSIDIGTYNSCPHGCIYCYANVNKEVANNVYKEHDPNSKILGQSKSDSDNMLKILEDKNTIDEKKIEDFFHL